MEPKRKINRNGFLYAVLFIIAALPLACDYVLPGRDVLLWLARVEEVKIDLSIGNFVLFPSIDVITAYNGQLTALDSNIWLVVPAVLRVMGLNIMSVWRIFMALLQLGTVFSAKLLFERLFEDRYTALFGVLFYITCPYRIYVCYDRGNLGQAVVWMLIPLFIRGLLGVYDKEHKYLWMAAAAVSLAGIGYANAITAVVFVGLAVLAGALCRNVKLYIPVLAGIVLFLPGAGRLLSYVLNGGMEEWNISVQTISNQGYSVGQFFNVYIYQENLPGLGLGLAGALFMLVWLRFTKEGPGMRKVYKLFLILGLLCLCLSLKWFPWDIVQRLAGPVFRLIPLFGTPGIFFGFASILFCVPAAFAAEGIRRHENRAVSVGGTVMLAAAAVGVALFLCNTLTFSRMPLFFTDSLP